MSKVYKCPHCGARIKKGVNNCPKCEKPISWIPVSNERTSVNTIVSRGRMGAGRVVSKSELEQLYQKLFLQMYEVVKKSWKVSTTKNGEYVASLDILVGEPQNIPKPNPVQVVKRTDNYTKPPVQRPPVQQRQAVQKPVQQPSLPQEDTFVGGNEYDRYIQSLKNNPNYKTRGSAPTPEFLEFQRKLQQDTIDMPQMNMTGDGFDMNMF